MKNFRWLALAACLTIVLAAPALAIDGSFKGTYEVWGVSNDHEDLTDASASNSWLQMLLDLNLNFQVNDNLTLITRFEALDKKWGTNQGQTTIDGANDEIYDGGNFTWQEAFLIAKTKIGGFVIGRMPDGPWGTNFGDTVGPADRFNWVVPIGKMRYAFTYEKWYEWDSEGDPFAALTGNSSPYDLSDADNDKYYLSAQYKDDTMKAGLIAVYYDVETLADLGTSLQRGIAASPSPLAALGALPGRPVHGEAYVLSPYFIGSFGPLDIQAEATYGWGTADGYFKKTATTSPADPAYYIGYEGERDIKVSTYMAEATYHMGPFALQAGYAARSGDALGADNDDEMTSFGLFEEGGDWAKMFILTENDYSGLSSSLGGLGNLSGGGSSQTCINGFQMWYIGAQYTVMDNLKLEFLYAKSKADEVVDHGQLTDPVLVAVGIPGGVYAAEERWDDDHGSEYDFNVYWKISENLSYRFTAAFLDAGDYWQKGNSSAEVEDLFTVFNMLTVKF